MVALVTAKDARTRTFWLNMRLNPLYMMGIVTADDLSHMDARLLLDMPMPIVISDKIDLLVWLTKHGSCEMAVLFISKLNMQSFYGHPVKVLHILLKQQDDVVSALSAGRITDEIMWEMVGASDGAAAPHPAGASDDAGTAGGGAAAPPDDDVSAEGLGAAAPFRYAGSLLQLLRQSVGLGAFLDVFRLTSYTCVELVGAMSVEQLNRMFERIRSIAGFPRGITVTLFFEVGYNATMSSGCPLDWTRAPSDITAKLASFRSDSVTRLVWSDARLVPFFMMQMVTPDDLTYINAHINMNTPDSDKSRCKIIGRKRRLLMRLTRHFSASVIQLFLTSLSMKLFYKHTTQVMHDLLQHDVVSALRSGHIDEDVMWQMVADGELPHGERFQYSYMESVLEKIRQSTGLAVFCSTFDTIGCDWVEFVSMFTPQDIEKIMSRVTAIPNFPRITFYQLLCQQKWRDAPADFGLPKLGWLPRSTDGAGAAAPNPAAVATPAVQAAAAAAAAAALDEHGDQSVAKKQRT